jgi:hypothetical protein
VIKAGQGRAAPTFSHGRAIRLKYVDFRKAPNKTRFRVRHADIRASHLGVAQKIGEN